MSQRYIVERQECLNCGFAGSAEEARRHAGTYGCGSFRVRTQVFSGDGRLLDERVEVYRVDPRDLRWTGLDAT